MTQAKPALPDSHRSLFLNQTPHEEPTPEPQPKPAPQFQEKLQPESQLLTETDPSPQSKPKPGPKTRSKSTLRKASPASAPTRQTRSQTRYQTRQQQNQPEPALGDHDPTTSDQKGLEVSDPGSEPEIETANKKDAPAMETTPETLGLSSDLISLDYDFNIE